jgi:hypothetical protein
MSFAKNSLFHKLFHLSTCFLIKNAVYTEGSPFSSFHDFRFHIVPKKLVFKRVADGQFCIF